MSLLDDPDLEVVQTLQGRGLVDVDTVDAARRARTDRTESVSSALLRLGKVRESEFLRCLGEVYRATPLSSDQVQRIDVPAGLLGKIDGDMARRQRAMPVSWDEKTRTLRVVAAPPVAMSLEPELKGYFDALSVDLCIATTTAVRALMQRELPTESIALDAHQEISLAAIASPPVAPLRQATAAKTIIALSDDSAVVAALRQENAKYRIAQEFHRRVTLERSFEAMVDRILAVMFELVPAEGVAIWFSSGELKSRTKTGSASLTIPRSIIDQTITSASGVLAYNAQSDGRFDRSKSVVVRGVKSVMAVPLRSRSRTLGVLYVESLSQAAAFNDQDLQLLDSIGSQASILLDNAELLVEVRRETENRMSLSRFLSAAAVEEVLAGRTTLKLDGQSTEVTVMFADIRGFTTLSGQMRPEEVVGTLNRYFGEMVEAIQTCGGTVDKFVGDCVMALWGAPHPKPDDVRNALRAAVSMLERAKKIEFGHKPLQMGIGINTGLAVLGCIGAPRRLEYTAIGSTVNIAARLCGIAPRGCALLTAETLMKAGPGVFADSTEPVLLKGIDVPIVPYTLKGFASGQGGNPIQLTQAMRGDVGDKTPPLSRKEREALERGRAASGPKTKRRR
jgi:adenylate cyclase